MAKYNVPTSQRSSVHVDQQRERAFLEALAASPVLTPEIEEEIDRTSHIKPNFESRPGLNIVERIRELGIGNPQDVHIHIEDIDDEDSEGVADDRLAIRISFENE